MKEKFYKYIPLVIGFVMALSSCGDDDDSNSINPEPLPAQPKPVINVTIGGIENQDSYFIEQFKGITFEINAISTAGSEAKLATIKMEQSGVNKTTAASDMTFISEGGTPFDLSRNYYKEIKDSENDSLKITKQFADTSSISNYPGTTTYNITLTDDNGVISTREVGINVFAPFKVVKHGEIYHIKSNKKGSYSLSLDSALSENASGWANLVNTDADASPFTGSFKIGYPYTILFPVPTGGFDFDNGHSLDAQAVIDAGTEVTNISNPAVGDLYIYYDETMMNIFVVKITSIDPSNNDCNCTNKGKMEFEYKKLH